MNKLPIVALSISALVLLCLCVNQNQRKAELHRSIASLQQEIKELSPDSSGSEMHTLKRNQKSLYQKNTDKYQEIQDDFNKTRINWDSYQEVTIQELAKIDPEAYRHLIHDLQHRIKTKSEQRDELLNLMVSLKPNELLTEEDIELFQDKIDESIQKLDADLSFQPRPQSRFAFETPEESTLYYQRLRNIIERYCAYETGLNDNDLIQDMNDYYGMVQPPHFMKVIPYQHRKQ